MTGDATFTITGGAGGIRAVFDDMDRTAELLRGIGTHLLELAAGAHRFLVDPDVAASAVLDPGGSRASRRRWPPRSTAPTGC